MSNPDNVSPEHTNINLSTDSNTNQMLDCFLTGLEKKADIVPSAKITKGLQEKYSNAFQALGQGGCKTIPGPA